MHSNAFQKSLRTDPNSFRLPIASLDFSVVSKRPRLGKSIVSK